MTEQAASAERAEIVAILAKHRGLFLATVSDLSDDQARLTPTVSTLSLGGLVKHVAATEATWLDFVENGPPPAGDGDDDVDWDNPDPAAYEAYLHGFRLLDDETLAGVVADYAAVAERADALVRSVDLDETHPLPVAPWFTPGEAWSNRRVFSHVLAETAQHAGHADIIRESIDGRQTMA